MERRSPKQFNIPLDILSIDCPSYVCVCVCLCVCVWVCVCVWARVCLHATTTSESD